MDHKIIYFGSGEFAAIILKKLAESEFRPLAVITQPDKPTGRRQTLSPSPVKIVAQKLGLEIRERRGLKNPEAEKMVKLFEPDLIVVADYGKIIPKNILDIPKFGALNIHPSLLPKYRGPSPIQYTILNGDKETGVTIILMDVKIDHGPIVAISDFRLPISDLTYSELLKKLADLGGSLSVETLPQWFCGEIKPVPQDESQVTYTKILTREDGKINWQKSAEEIEHQIRAFEKWPQSWSEWQSNSKKLRLKILKTKVLHPAIGCAENSTPGFVFLTEQKEMAINCNPGSLIVEKLQIEGKDKMGSREFMHGHSEIVGATLI
jgi:methionyl-tRNA formyltransferase